MHDNHAETCAIYTPVAICTCCTCEPGAIRSGCPVHGVEAKRREYEESTICLTCDAVGTHLTGCPETQPDRCTGDCGVPELHTSPWDHDHPTNGWESYAEHSLTHDKEGL